MMKYDFESTMVLTKGEVNTGERFPCAVCGKSYLRKRHLQRHMRDECIGIPPRFSCELCPSRFRRKYHMVRHLTSKHSIPPAIAQQATGGGTRATTTTSTTAMTTMNTTTMSNNNNFNVTTTSNLNLLKNNESANESDGGNVATGTASCMGGVENLSLRRDLFDNNNVGLMRNGGGSHVSESSPAHSGGACSSSGTHSPLPTYGLTGAITAISSAFATNEQHHDAMAVAAAAAAAAAMHMHDDRTLTENNNDADTAGAATTNSISIKSEPVSPNSKIISSTTTTMTAENVDNVVKKLQDEDWKMKLSLQLISNSLLKERLMNTLPFGSGYNNSN